MTIDLCIVHFKTPDKLERLLSNLRTSDKFFGVHIVDNSYHEDQTLYDLCQGVSWLNCDNIWFNANIGYAKACNYMAARTDGDILGFLNGDVWLTPSDIMSIQKSFDENPEMAILGPKQRDEQGKIRHGGIVGSNTKPIQRGWGISDVPDTMFRDVMECVTVSGSAYFIRRNVFDELTQCPIYQEVAPDALGAFLPTPHYYEETWISYHARAHGHKVFYDGRISIGHTWKASCNDDRMLRNYFLESRKIFRAACDAHGIERD